MQPDKRTIEKMGAGSESKTTFFNFFKKAGSIGRWETKYFMGITLIYISTWIFEKGDMPDQL